MIIEPVVLIRILILDDKVVCKTKVFEKRTYGLIYKAAWFKWQHC